MGVVPPPEQSLQLRPRPAVVHLVMHVGVAGVTTGEAGSKDRRHKQRCKSEAHAFEAQVVPVETQRASIERISMVIEVLIGQGGGAPGSVHRETVGQVLDQAPDREP